MKNIFWKTGRLVLMAGVIVVAVACCPKQKQTERIIYNDPETGNEVWQITSGDTLSNTPYFEAQAFTGDDKYVIFKSWRETDPKLFRSALSDGEITKLSDRMIEGAYSIDPSGREVWFMADGVLYAVDVETLKERVVSDLSALTAEGDIWFSASFTNDGKYTLVSTGTWKGKTDIYRIELPEGKAVKVYTAPEGCSHPQMNPVYPDLISFVPYPDRQNDMSLTLEERARTWLVDLSTGVARPFLMMPTGYRATHETWSTDGERFFFFRKVVPGSVPVAVCSIDKTGGDFRVEYEDPTIKLGHGIGSHDGKWFVADSQDSYTNPLQLINLQTHTSQILCWPNSTQAPKEGNPQEDHVHPSFSASGKYIAFTSDRGTGIPQAFVIPIEKFLK